MALRLRSIDRLFARFARTGDADALGRVFDRTAAELTIPDHGEPVELEVTSPDR